MTKQLINRPRLAILAGMSGLVAVCAVFFYFAHSAIWNYAELEDQLSVTRLEVEQANEELIRLRKQVKEIDRVNGAMTADFFNKVGLSPLAPTDPAIMSDLVRKSNDPQKWYDPRMESLETNTESVGQLLSDAYQRMLTRREYTDAIPSMTPSLGWISSQYGVRKSPFTGKLTSHNGIDIAAPEGTPIYAPADGIVGFAGKFGGYGKYVSINHGFGIVTRYGHNKKYYVYPGQFVRKGQKIALVGSTGRSTGSHLHYEIRINNKPVDPRPFMLDAGEKILGELFEDGETTIPLTDWRPVEYPMGGDESEPAVEADFSDSNKVTAANLLPNTTDSSSQESASITMAVSRVSEVRSSAESSYIHRLRTAVGLVVPWFLVGLCIAVIAFALTRLQPRSN